MNTFDENTNPAGTAEAEEDEELFRDADSTTEEEPSGDGHDLSELLAMIKGIAAGRGDGNEKKDEEEDEDEDEDEDDDDEPEGMDADGFQNRGVDFARRRRFAQAAQVCMKGLKRFPNNVDLLADTIKYSCRAGRTENAVKHYKLLRAVPYARWNWRAFTFSFDCLLEIDPAGNEAECREIIAAYRRHLPYNEKASMAESELESALGNHERSLEVLKEAVAGLSNAVQCAMRLADMQMERGSYEAVLDACNYAIAASAEVQPSIKIPYLYLVRALAKDHLLHRKECDHVPISREEVAALAAEYKLLVDEFPEMRMHVPTIKLRAKMLKFVQTA